MIDVYELLSEWGLDEHPFSQYVAEMEPRLDEYFVPPPYLDQILGTATHPTSFILFGARGSGKSAIRIVLERYCRDPNYSVRLKGRVLAVTYDDFDYPLQEGLGAITLGHHLEAILRSLVAGVLQAILDRKNEEEEFLDRYPEENLKVLEWFVKRFYLDLPEEHREHSVRAVSMILDSREIWIEKGFQTFWYTIKKPLAEVAAWIANVRGGEQDAEDLRIEGSEAIELPSLKTLEKLRFAAAPIGIDAFYVLIDKLDENEKTDRNAENATKLLHPLLSTTKILEIPGFAFKLFVWDHVRAYLSSDKYEVRLDKFRNELLQWSSNDVLQMLDERLRAYSDGRVKGLKEIAQATAIDVLTNAVTTYSSLVPREAVQIMDAIIREHSRIAADTSERLSLEAVQVGLDAYSVRRAQDMYPRKLIQEIAGKLDLTTFTNRDVQGEFSIGSQGARSKIQGWINRGAVQQTGTRVVEDADKPLHEYSVVDPRLRNVIERKLQERFDFISST